MKINTSAQVKHLNSIKITMKCKCFEGATARRRSSKFISKEGFLVIRTKFIHFDIRANSTNNVTVSQSVKIHPYFVILFISRSPTRIYFISQTSSYSVLCAMNPPTLRLISKAKGCIEMGDSDLRVRTPKFA